MNNLILRTLTGGLFVAVVVGSILWHPMATGALFLLFTIVGTFEFYRMVSTPETKPQLYTGILLSIITYLCIELTFLKIISAHWYIVLFPVIIFIVIAELYRKQKSPWQSIAYTLVAALNISVPLAIVNRLAGIVYINDTMIYSYQPLLGFFILMWLSDTGAYLVGISFGKHRLFERVSPKKSWEGTIGGGVICIAGSWGLYLWLGALPLYAWIAMAVIVVIFGNFGDLSESLLKRSVGVKDSGKILPGHGGILDRFDATLIASPMVYALFYFVKNIFF